MIAVRFHFPSGREWRYLDTMLPAVPRMSEQVVVHGSAFIVACVTWELDHPHLEGNSDRQFVVDPHVTVYLK